MKSWFPIAGRNGRRVLSLAVALLVLISLISCKRGALQNKEYAYVAATQVNLRDRVAALYNKTGTAKNGEKLEVLEKQKRFVRVRTQAGLEGWVEQRYLVDQGVYDGFQKLAADNAGIPLQAKGATRAELNMHLTADRDADHLYQLLENEKVEVLKRASAEKPMPKIPVKLTGDKKPEDAPKPMEDWFLVRDSQKRVGWVLSRMIDIDVPLEVAQYAEGQRIVACFVVNRVTDGDKQVPQYLMLLTEPKDGQPFDFNQMRVFTWNPKRDRYETAYRERNLNGFLPVNIGTENFEREGTLPTFTIREKDPSGNVVAKKYKLNQPIVRRVMTPEDQAREVEMKRQRLAERQRAGVTPAVRKSHRRR